MKRLKSGGFVAPSQGNDGMNPYLALGGSGNMHGKQNEGQNWNGEESFRAVKLENWNEYPGYGKGAERHARNEEASEDRE